MATSKFWVPKGLLYLASSILRDPQILGASVQEFVHPWL